MTPLILSWYNWYITVDGPIFVLNWLLMDSFNLITCWYWSQGSCSVYVSKCSYFSIHSQVIGPNSMMFVRNMITKLQEQQTNILRFIACSEIFLMPAIVFMTFRLVLTVIFWQFYNLNYTCFGLCLEHFSKTFSIH